MFTSAPRPAGPGSVALPLQPPGLGAERGLHEIEERRNDGEEEKRAGDAVKNGNEPRGRQVREVEIVVLRSLLGRSCHCSFLGGDAAVEALFRDH